MQTNLSIMKVYSGIHQVISVDVKINWSEGLRSEVELSANVPI